MKGSQLVQLFIGKLRQNSKYKVTTTRFSQNVYKLSNGTEVLIYIKGRAGEPHKWGITKNVVDRLMNQSIPWFVVLLYDTPETGFLLTQKDATNYILTVWPLGRDGDYKPATGTYLKNNSPFNSIEALLDQLVSLD